VNAPFTVFRDPPQMPDAERTAEGGQQVQAINVNEFLALEIPPRALVLSPWLPEKGLAMIHAPRGLGKTHVALGSAWAIATGGGFLTWKAPRPRRVLLIDGEMPAVALQERLRKIAAASEHADTVDPDYFRIASADLARDGLPDLADPAAQEFYDDVVGDADVVFADNLSTLCPSLKENDADSWSPVQSWALRLRRAGKSGLLVHHGGKSGAQRGTSRKEDILDTVIALRKPPDYTSDQGARFEIHFEKNRGFFGPEAAAFEAWLINGAWKIGDITAGDDDGTLQALRKQGKSVRDIAERTGMSKSKVQRRLAIVPNSNPGGNPDDCPMGHPLGVSHGTVPAEPSNGRDTGTGGTAGTDGTNGTHPRPFENCLPFPGRRPCAQCNLDDGQQEAERDGNHLVWLHSQCRRFYQGVPARHE
jgi:hypothetical protein